MNDSDGNKSITSYSEDGTPIMEIFSITRSGNKLIMDGKALGTMRMDVIVPIEEVVKGLGIVVNRHVISFILLLPVAIFKSWIKIKKNKR
jgi:hypothetical protein